MSNRSRFKEELPEQQNPLDPFQIYELIFQQKLFLTLIGPDSEEANVQPLLFKLMRIKNSEKFLVFILCENDLYFLYKIQVSSETMKELNQKYSLCLKRLEDFIDFFRASLDDVQNREKMGIVEVIREFDSSTIFFSIRKAVGGKTHTVIELEGKKESEQIIKVHVAFMYGSLRERIYLKQLKIEQLKEIVRVKNPYLLKHFKT